MPKLLTNAFLCVALSTALTLSTPVALLAQSTTPAPAKTDTMKSDAKSGMAAPADKMKTAKPLTAQQQKMKDCGGKWQDEKKTKGVSGKAAYKTFMSTCLKG